MSAEEITKSASSPKSDSTIHISSKRPRNPNPEWQKKFGRTSRDNNVYEISDIEEKECGTSNEWCTPQSSSNCGMCLFAISLIGIILMSFSLGINMSDFHSIYAENTCGDDDPYEFKVGDKISTFQIWEYLSAIILVACIVALLSSCYNFWCHRQYIINEQGESNKSVEQWNIGNTRVCCRCQTCLWFAIFIFIVIWFWIMVGIVAGLDQIATAKNCRPDTVSTAAGHKLLAFGFLITCSIIAALCCGVPFIIVMICGRADDNRKDWRKSSKS